MLTRCLMIKVHKEERFPPPNILDTALFWHSRFRPLARPGRPISLPNGTVVGLWPSVPPLTWEITGCKISQEWQLQSPLSCPIRDTSAFTAEVISYLSFIKQNLTVCFRGSIHLHHFSFNHLILVLSFTNPQRKFGYRVLQLLLGAH